MTEVSHTHVASAATSEATRLSNEGFACLEARDFARARMLLERATALAPDDAHIHYRLGLLHGDLREFPQALARFDQALRLDPRHYRALNNRGTALQMLGRWDEAEAAFRQALALAPATPQPYLNLGHLLEERGRLGEAADTYRAAMARNLDPPVFAHCLAALEGATTQRAPDAWVVATFDNFAPTFEAHLHDLGYDVPRRLARLVEQRRAERLDVLDLGCGTGLCGAALGARCKRLVGVDLSPAMLEQARARGDYDELLRAEVHEWLTRCASDAFDLVVAADVLIYIGALDALFTEIGRVLRPGGLFAFSTEECSGASFVLQASGRYAQSVAYVHSVVPPGMRIEQSPAAVIRMESGVPVAGRIWLAAKGGAA